jgi:hypothetical protein|tara:strand:+ start:4562 stop:5401 length:840 start_codon:yes stop_codon:yes gene_type:complete
MGRRNRIADLTGFASIRPDITPRWRNIMDLNFKTMTAGVLAENQGSLTALDGYEYHCRRGNADFSATMTDGTGLVTSFSIGSTQQNRVAWKIQNYLRNSDGSYPRMRVSASFTGLAFSHNNDYIAVGMNGGFANNGSPYAPGVYMKYDSLDASASPQTKKYGTVLIGGWGGTSSSTQPSTQRLSDSETTGVLTVEDGGAGVFFTRGDDGTVDIKTGNQSQTLRNTCFSIYKTANNLTDQRYWQDPDGTTGGPYAVLYMRAGTDGSQVVTWERMVVEAYY